MRSFSPRSQSKCLERNNLNTKILNFAILFVATCSTAHARGFDIYENPLLNDPTLATTFVNQLRNKTIKDMDKIIEGECYQLKNYVYLSIDNWTQAKKNFKSMDEAESYSQQLTREIPFQQANQYTFPFGIRTYIENEKILKDRVLNSSIIVNKTEIIDDEYKTCIKMNSQKYFIILSSNQYTRNNKPIFLTDNEVSKKFDSSQSFLKLSNAPTDSDRITPKDVGKKINFTEEDLGVANALINEDIKNSFEQSDISWLDYKKISYQKQNDFEGFMKNGGRNKPFAQVASIVKIISLERQGFKNIKNKDINIINFKDIPNYDQKLKLMLKNFNY